MAEEKHFLPGETREQFLKRVNPNKFGPPLPSKPATQGKSISKNVIPKVSASYGPAFAENPMATGKPAPRNFLSDIADAAARTRKIYENRDAGLTADGRPIPTRKINMQTGMGNTDAKKVFAEKPSAARGLIDENPLKFIGANSGIPMGKALGYGVSLVKRGLEKGTGMKISDYVERLKGSDVFRKLDPQSQRDVLKAYNQWFDTQSAFSQRRREEVKNEARTKAYEASTADIGKTF